MADGDILKIVDGHQALVPPLGIVQSDPIASGAAILHEPAADVDANASATAIATGAGNADASKTATATGGNVLATTVAAAGPGGSADASTTATTIDGEATARNIASSTTGIASAGFKVSSAELQANFDLYFNNGVLGFDSSAFLSSGAGAPGAAFTTMLYLDTNATTGGLYAWDPMGFAYVRVGLALS